MAIDWRSSAKRDFIALFGGVVLASILAYFSELGPRLFQLGPGYSDSTLDGIVFIIIVAFFVSVALTLFTVRRYGDLARETKARTIAEIEARDLAPHDQLTGLPNRRSFDEKLHACLRLAGNTRRVAVLMLRLVGFKRIKDTHGHAAGEKALCEFADRLGDVLRADGVLARIGGDEFSFAALSRQILSSRTTRRSFRLAVIASAGSKPWARWKNRTFGHIPPDVFIPIAEEAALINALGDQLLRRACFDASTWPEMFTRAFNISPVQLRDPRLRIAFYRSLGKPGSVRAAWRLKLPRARSLKRPTLRRP
ncbi:putative signal transduction protein with EAL and GGDEF domain [Bradyrhizobium sp. GM5.1]|nr:diguanylate cyclase [Bradyrhizobium sp. 155]